MPFRYFAFGLRIDANIAVPGLVPSDIEGRPDIQIWLNSSPAELAVGGVLQDPARACIEPEAISEPWVTVWRQGRYWRLLYPDGTEFFVEQTGTQVWATWPGDLTLADTATYLLGPIMNIVLRVRGTLALHASAVQIGDVAVAFVGPGGAGKSTTAATFAVAGDAVLTDDIAAVDDRGNVFRIVPAYPRVRLWPASVNLLFGSTDALPLLTPGWEKRYLQLKNGEHRFASDSKRLAAIYFLYPRDPDLLCPTVEEESHREALVQLIGNFGANYLLDHVEPRRSFDLAQRLAKHVPMRRLVPNSGVAALAQVRDAVINDLETLQRQVH